MYDFHYNLTDRIPNSSISYPYVRPFNPAIQMLQCENPAFAERKKEILAGKKDENGRDIRASNLYG